MIRRYAKKIIQRLTENDYRTLNRIELRADNLLHNVELVQAQHPDFEIIPVLKGNAYGHGLAQVAEILNRANCKYVAVDGYFEAAKIRDITKHHILVMGHVLPDNTRLLDMKRCSFVVQDTQGLAALGALHRPVSIHVELNTGFNRLGIQPDELSAYLKTVKQFPQLKLAGVMTHLVDADNPSDDSFDKKQQKLFDKLVLQILDAGFDPKLVHIAQTAGSTKIHSAHANALRLGIGTYGINPLLPDDPHYADLDALKPVLELKSTVIKIIELQKGDTVSYNATFTAPKNMRIGVLPLGYYEGVPRELSGKGHVTYKNEQLPIVGRVCMNHTMINLKQSDVAVGDEVTVISPDSAKPNSVIGMRRRLDLFPYTTITKLSESVRRVTV
jgi:alanine racemase